MSLGARDASLVATEMENKYHMSCQNCQNSTPIHSHRHKILRSLNKQIILYRDAFITYLKPGYCVQNRNNENDGTNKVLRKFKPKEFQETRLAVL